MSEIYELHVRMVSDLIGCVPESERARELRAMVRRLEDIEPSLEQQRIAAMQERLSGEENSGGESDQWIQ
jgi:hypothetical protein